MSSTADDWIEKKDPKSGRTYYVNTKTHQSSWTKPSPAASEKPKAAKAAEKAKAKQATAVSINQALVDTAAHDLRHIFRHAVESGQARGGIREGGRGYHLASPGTPPPPGGGVSASTRSRMFPLRLQRLPV